MCVTHVGTAPWFCAGQLCPRCCDGKAARNGGSQPTVRVLFAGFGFGVLLPPHRTCWLRVFIPCHSYGAVVEAYSSSTARVTACCGGCEALVKQSDGPLTIVSNATPIIGSVEHAGAGAGAGAGTGTGAGTAGSEAVSVASSSVQQLGGAAHECRTTPSSLAVTVSNNHIVTVSCLCQTDGSPYWLLTG